MKKSQPPINQAISRSQALAWECLPSSSAWRSDINVKINLFCSPPHQAELGNRHSQTGVWERENELAFQNDITAIKLSNYQESI